MQTERDRVKIEAPRRKDYIERDRRTEQDRDIRVAVQSKSASSFLREMEQS